MAAPLLTRRQFPLVAAMPVLFGQDAPARKRRSESYFGLHFDLHPSPQDPALGRDVSEEMVERIVSRARPDYIQYDAKGHVGWPGWPSKVSDPAPHIVNDSLAIYRKVTARRGVALYIHFSGVWDTKAITDHPEWARLDAEGEPDGRNTSTFGPYVDLRLLPQLREAATNYDLDGAWVDGECWSVAPDYGDAAAKAFREKTGLSYLPKKPGEPGWDEFLELNREQFRRYVRHYVDEIHGSHPKFQVASNWLYSTLVPEKPELPVDFISGDYLGNAAISTARLESRYMPQTGKPWDLMAWGFQQANSNSVGHIHKPAVQLMQEASVVLAQGGGFQIYYVPSRAGYFEESHIETMGRVAEFCRARQQWSHKSEAVPQIGVVFSKETLYRTANKLFGGWGKNTDPARGWIDALLACQWSVDVLPDWKLSAEWLRQYPMVVLPDWSAIGDEVRRLLHEYAGAGGQLVISGAENMALFAGAIGVKLSGEPKEQAAFIGGGEVLANLKSVWQDIDAGPAQVLATRHPDHDTRKDGKAAAVYAAVGKGWITAVPGQFGRVFAATHAAPLRSLVKRLVGPRFQPLVEVEAPPTVEVALRRKEGRLLVHLLNTTAMQVAGDYATTDFVPPVGPIRVRLKAAEVTVEPEGRQLKVQNGQVTLERLEIHSILATSLAASR